MLEVLKSATFEAWFEGLRDRQAQAPHQRTHSPTITWESRRCKTDRLGRQRVAY